MIIRPAIPADAAGISAVLTTLAAAGLRISPDDEGFALNNYITDPNRIRCSVAEVDGTIIGLQSVKHAVPGNIYGVTPGWGIIGTHIHPDAARQGVGKALFAISRQAAADAGIKFIDATIGRTNAGGLAYYETMGFRTYRETKEETCKKYTL